MFNNLIYANANFGIDATSGTLALTGNTIYQPVGNAIQFTGSGTPTLTNNILWVEVGVLVSVSTGSQSGFTGDYNLFFPSTPSASVGSWGGTTAATLADWQTLTSQDGNSVSGDPLFIDIDGADNVLGEQGVDEGNGDDDNFGLRAGSPAIDFADGFLALVSDAQGRPRHDDPSTPNTGIGPDNLVEVDQGASLFAATGTPQNFRVTGGSRSLNLPFEFPFHGSTYASVQLGPQGLLYFEGNEGISGRNFTSSLGRNVRIAPLWDDLVTTGPGDDIFIDDANAGQITIRWSATHRTTGEEVNVSVTLLTMAVSASTMVQAIKT